MERWIAASNLIWTHFDDTDEWVVYNPASADIHLLSSAARELWRLIDERPLQSAADLVAALAQALARDADADLQTATSDSLAMMDRVGLVRPASS